ncbi:hypothetical protein V1512DRAFT_260686 [Lipomyces arxii]|uniref:uncharacterized protein n=1 Tax=Lipomyces arxii TaxID=56418 RepID=UPI0034CFEB93
MRPRSLRPPDIVLPPPFPTSANQSLQTNNSLASPAPLATPSLRPQARRSASSTSSLNGSSMRSRRAYPPITPVNPQAGAYFNIAQPLRTPSMSSQSTLSVAEAAAAAAADSSHSSFDSASTDDDEDDAASEPDTPESSPKRTWSAQQDHILRRAMDFHLSDPRTAPFAGHVPPPTLLHRIVKTVIRLSQDKCSDLTKHHSSTEIRKRVIEISSPTYNGEDIQAIASPLLRATGRGGLRNLTEKAISNDSTNPYFSLALQSPFHESTNPIGLVQTSKRKFDSLESVENDSALV